MVTPGLRTRWWTYGALTTARPAVQAYACSSQSAKMGRHRGMPSRGPSDSPLGLIKIHEFQELPGSKRHPNPDHNATRDHRDHDRPRSLNHLSQARSAVSDRPVRDANPALEMPTDTRKSSAPTRSPPNPVNEAYSKTEQSHPDPYVSRHLPPHEVLTAAVRHFKRSRPYLAKREGAASHRKPAGWAVLQSGSGNHPTGPKVGRAVYAAHGSSPDRPTNHTPLRVGLLTRDQTWRHVGRTAQTGAESRAEGQQTSERMGTYPTHHGAHVAHGMGGVTRRREHPTSLPFPPPGNRRSPVLLPFC